MLIVLFLTVMALAYVNGANDNIKPMATLFGSGALSYRWALSLATAGQLAGSTASIVLATSLIKTFSGKGIVPDAMVGDVGLLLAVALGATAAVSIATRIGMPISTTHGLVGGLLGAALALAPADIAWMSFGSRVALPLLISPALALIAAAALYPMFSRVRRRLGIGAETCVCVERPVTATVTARGEATAVVGPVQLRMGSTDSCNQRYSGTIAGVSAHSTVQVVHVGSALALAFARGLNDTPKILALLVAASFAGISMHLTLGLIAVAMATGGVVHTWRVARTMGLRITPMNPGQGVLANVVASTLVIGASLLGSPVSTTHVTTGGIFGIGCWTGNANRRVIVEILLAWVVTLPIAGLVAALVVTLWS